jgi:saccharopine dehydrogenase-like NADP-dependent oxidoreductase
MNRSRVVVVGGAGVFGSRLVRGLVQTTEAEIVVAGRNPARAQAAVRGAGASNAVVLDRSRATAADIASLGASLVIDAAGPFQGADLSFARACISAGVDYLDLSDARDFVAAFPSLDAEARTQNVRAITGASSTPALTHAALDQLTKGWRRIDMVRAGISAGNRAPRGLSMIEAILSWTGAPVRVFEGRQWITRAGWSRTFSHALPGIGRRSFALAETPDLDLIPARFSPCEDGVFTAGLELGVMHRGMSVVGGLRRIGLLKDLRPLAGLLQNLAMLLAAFGTDRGCMFVEACGRDAENNPVRTEWTLVAPPVEGPFTPTLPALVLARQLIASRNLGPGARACAGILSLDDLQSDFARHGLTTGITQERLTGAFELALGEDFGRLPEIVRESHRQGRVARFRGTARVDGPAWLAMLPAFLFGLPRSARAAPVEVEKRLVAGGREIWKRNIGGSLFRSEITYVRPGRVRERFGPFSFDLDVAADERRHTMTIAGWRFGPIPLPHVLAPKSTAIEAASDGGVFTFDVPVVLPLAGRLTRYKGELRLLGAAEPQKQAQAT